MMNNLAQMNFRYFVVALTTLLALAACDRYPPLPEVKPNDIIVAFGDSLTHGNGASSEQSYPAVLSRLIGRTVINAGVPGETTAEGMARLPEVLAYERPALVLLCLGGNDMLRSQNPADTESNLRKMIQTIRESGASVVLIGVPQPSLFSGPPDFYEELAKEFKLPYEGEIFDEVLKNPRTKSDAIHANAEGYRLVAERLAEILRKSGAI